MYRYMILYALCIVTDISPELAVFAISTMYFFFSFFFMLIFLKDVRC